jgi:DNA-binding transcriptional LysR family regulator
MRERKSHKTDRLPPLHSLQVFEAAARHESFVQAAAELCVTHGAVSRQVRQLEESLGLALFERRNRAVFLTPQGRTLHDACSQALGQLRQTLQALCEPEAPAPLVVSCEPTIAMRWLIPRLPLWRQQHPELALHLLAAGGPVDFARERVDMALRRSDFQWPEHVHVERLAPELMGPVMAPGLADAWNTRPSELRELHTRTRPQAWPLWRQRTGHTPLRGNVESFEHFYLSLQAALAGVGVAMGSMYMVEDDLSEGRLQAPHGFTPDGSSYVLLSPTPLHTDPRRVHFAQWVRHEMQTTRARLGHG